MTQYIYVCTGAREGHRLERAANMIIINFLLLLTIIDIHILTSLRYNSADLKLATWLIGRAGASPPSRTAAIIFLYNYLFIYISVSYVVP